MPVVDDLVARAAAGRPASISTVIVHTANPVCRGNIERALTRAGYHVFAVGAGDYLTS